jgi:Domain of unknown function (DUF2019)
MTDFQNLTEEELVGRFSKAAKHMGRAVLASAVGKANASFQMMWDIDLVLRSRGRWARLKLLPLLDSSDRFVRYYAAKKLLGVVPGRARAEIEWNADFGFDAIAGDARGLLRAFDSGEYKPD